MTGPEDQGGRVIFADTKRNLADEQKTTLTSVGVDIGSSTSHLVFSEVRLEQEAGRYVVADRGVLYESDILLTPYADSETIDADALRAFIEDQYRWARLTPDDIDTGALILTGVALRQKNARMIGDLFSVETGKFVSVSAGDRLEAAMAAYGSGAAVNSELTGATVMNVDIGGGTTKIAICRDGQIADLTAVDIGARLIAADETGRIVRLEEAGKRLAQAAGIHLSLGEPVAEGAFSAIASGMADRLMEIILQKELSDQTTALHRIPPIGWHGRVDAVTFSGGVSEFIYGYGDGPGGDVGPALAIAVRSRAEEAGLRVMEPVESIRATVVGASQYSIQLSGTTIFVDPPEILPLRNVPVIAPALSLGTGDIDADAVATVIGQSLIRFELDKTDGPAALCFDWTGSAGFGRVDAFLTGVENGMAPILSDNRPLILVCAGDIGRVFGRHAREERGRSGPVVSIDGIELKEFDYIDIGAPLAGSAAVPVVIKSLLFPGAARRH